MRISTLVLLAADTPEQHFTGTELENLSAVFRENIRDLITAVRARAYVLPQTSANRAAALAGIDEAEDRLRLGNGDTDPVRGAVAVRLARSVKTLCGHYERLAPR
ncbi:DUF6415 family natural product biosynthesis protein [Streptomyces sp. 900105755]